MFCIKVLLYWTLSALSFYGQNCCINPYIIFFFIGLKVTYAFWNLDLLIGTKDNLSTDGGIQCHPLTLYTLNVKHN